MVRCFKNSLGVRTENNSSTPLHNLLTILWASSKLPAVYYKDLCLPLRESSCGNKQIFQAYIHERSMLKSPYMYLLDNNNVVVFLSLCRRPSKSHTNIISLPLPPVGQQPSGRPEEEKPLGVSQWASRSSTAAHFPPAGLSFSSKPAAGWHQPHRRVRPHPLPPGLRPLQPGLLVHLPGQGHHGECQVLKSHSVILVHLHPPWYWFKGVMIF